MSAEVKKEQKNLLKAIGPGLLFASSAIGTSHLVLSTRAGAHHGMVYFWIILAALILKYPFYEFGPRYATATGFSLVKGYRDQGKWAVYIFMLIVIVGMFTVTAAIGAVSAGIVSTMFGVKVFSVPILAGLIIALTIGLLVFGGYRGLDQLIKLITVVLLLTVVIAFVAVLIKGPISIDPDFVAPNILEGAGLGLLIGLLGWMPSGMEASTMNSIWSVEKVRTTKYKPSLRESLFDFKLGYFLTTILALMFLTIGAFTVFGSGELLGGNATQFSNKLLAVFTSNLGPWSYWVISIAAFGTIYGTLITVMDAFPRCFIRCIRVLKFEEVKQEDKQVAFLEYWYRIIVIIAGVGGFCLFYFSAASMIKLLDVVTIISFLLGPIVAFLNIRAIQSDAVSAAFRPAKGLIWLAYLGLAAMLLFAVYYLWSL